VGPNRGDLATLAGHSGPVISAAFSIDGTRVVTSDGRTARLWDVTSGHAIASLEDGYKHNAVAFSPDGTRLVTGADDRTARVWDAATGRPIATLAGHGAEVVSVAFSPDGSRIITASADKAVRVWDVSTIPKGDILQVACSLLRMHEDPVILEGVTAYPLTFDRPICVTDPPPPDLTVEPAAAATTVGDQEGDVAGR
jgi:WD40 repeat protein